MTVHHVVIQIRRPVDVDPGQISEGYYTVEDGILTMTHADGVPVSPDQFRCVLKDVDDPAAIARVLTREVRSYVLGISKDAEAFNRPLDYGPSGVA